MSRRGRRRRRRSRQRRHHEYNEQTVHGPPPILWNGCSILLFSIFWLGFWFLNIFARDTERFGFPWGGLFFLIGFTVLWTVFSVFYTKKYKEQYSKGSHEEEEYDEWE